MRYSMRREWSGKPGGMQTFIPCDMVKRIRLGFIRPCTVCQMIGESMLDFGRAMSTALPWDMLGMEESNA